VKLYAVGLSQTHVLFLFIPFFLLLPDIFLVGAFFLLYVRCRSVSGGQKTPPFCTDRIEVILLMLLPKGGPRWRKSRIASDTVLKTLGPHNPKPNMLFFYSKEKRGPKPNLLGLKNYRQSTVIFLKDLRLLH
jgi:hypothetical protein